MTTGFRPLRREDLPLVADWLRAPHVARWWRDPADPASVEARYGPAIDGSDATEMFVVELDGAPVGLFQRYLIDDNPGWKESLAPVGAPDGSVGIDYLIGVPDLTGRGLGSRLIEQFVADSWRRYPDAPAIVVAVQQENPASWRALEKSGFERVWAGVLESDDPSDSGPSYVYTRRRPLLPGAETTA